MREDFLTRVNAIPISQYVSLRKTRVRRGYAWPQPQRLRK